MRIISLVSSALITLAVAGSASAADDATSNQGFAALKGVKAVPMAVSELKEVKGMHVHMLDANGGFHLTSSLMALIKAGVVTPNTFTEHNWYLNGSPDGEPVHPSYHGLCVADPILIPAVPSQCP